MAAAAPTVKRVALELGGKNPNVVFADADFEPRPRLRAHRRVPALRPGLLGRRPAPGRRGVLHDRFVDELVERAADDPARWPVRREGRDRAAHLGRASRQGGRGTSQPRLAEGAALALRGRAFPTIRQLQPAASSTSPRSSTGCRPAWTVVARRVVRPGAHRRDLHRRGRGRAHRPTTPTTGWPARSGRQDAGKAQRVAQAAAARHDLDQRLPPVRAAGRVGRVQPVRASAANWAEPDWPNTARPSTSGTTSNRRRSRFRRMSRPSKTGARDGPGPGLIDLRSTPTLSCGRARAADGTPRQRFEHR